MLTENRVELILDLVKKEYDYMDNRPIYIFIKGGNQWCVESSDSFYMLNIEEDLINLEFTNFYYRYLALEFKFDLTWARVDYQSTITALALLHEIGHIQQTMRDGINHDYVIAMNKIYDDYKQEAADMTDRERQTAYRRISYEYSADKFAVDMFNKYAVKILAILNGTTQKEIKSRMNALRRQRKSVK